MITRLVKTLAVTILLVSNGCDRHHVSGENLPWPQKFAAHRAYIINGPDDALAYDYWSDLHLTLDPRNQDELNSWLQLQADILEKTEADPNRDYIRIAAMQQMYFYPEASHPYIPWIRHALDSGFFREKKVRERATEMLQNVEKNDPTTQPEQD